MVRWVGVAALLLAAPALGQEDEPDAPHVRIYKQVAPAVVAVQEDSSRSSAQRGSGVVIDKSGIILTSPTACGTSGSTATVVLKGGRQFKGTVMGRVNEKELVLLKIDAKDLPAVELGDSDRVRVGHVSYVLGDCFESLVKDDQPAISVGVISGLYEVTKRQHRTYYTGKAIETSAAVNPDQDGGPLVDRHGRLIGIVTLNYDDSKFTGIAIPVNELKADVERIRKEFEAGVEAAAPAPRGKPGDAWFGLEVRAGADGLEVTRVARNSPAEKAGVKKGDLLTAVDSVKTSDESSLAGAIARKAPGESVRVKVLRDGVARDLTATLVKKPVY